MKSGIPNRRGAHRRGGAAVAGGASISAEERVMSAYASKYRLSSAQYAAAYAEICRIVDELKTWPRRGSSTAAALVLHGEGAGHGIRMATNPVPIRKRKSTDRPEDGMT